ncbi:Mur ligase family protein [Gleimia hominis]|uniref:Mur ligase family protein n=1 Tax=Gleimia hominis TaxID=595468 RepID=UPI00130446FD|nr:UDP-N-acetylmuramoyl-L-alanyl-D-glutamate--2,6-diaminopimelate ligase [Gleimia hominis]WIK65240.1 UDP-N-acetylmuramoyl-L-alanyl-D-glutamate--2,6-diaminopimelate ligase [Gleimia hominis]
MELEQLRPTAVQPKPIDALGGRVIRSGPAITGVTLDSTDVQPGDLFVAVPGAKHHGAEFAKQAFERGAVAVATDARGVELIADLDAGVLQVANPRVFAGDAAAQVYGHPSSKLIMVGITGTNGKTTTTHFVRHALQSQGLATLLLGTVGVSLAGVHVPSARTSLEAPVLHRVLAWALEQGAQAAVMEVSSHALTLHRVQGLRFDTVGFLNLQRDHLDFHHTMEAYFEAKAALFTQQLARRAVICIDDPWGQKLARRCEVPFETVLTQPGSNGTNSGWSVEETRADTSTAGTDVVVSHAGEHVHMHCPLPGDINVQNATVALAAATQVVGESGAATPAPADAAKPAAADAAGTHASAHVAEQVAEAISNTPQVPGRMEVIAHRDEQTPLVIVDFAHTADALTAACRTLDPVTPGHLWLLFGATGERDRGKRPLMAQAAQAAADTIIVTDDDVYGEDPATIRAEVLAGFTGKEGRASHIWEGMERAAAIDYAVTHAKPADTVVIAGRGHETIQTIGTSTIFLDDRERARQALKQRRLGAVASSENMVAHHPV